MRGEGRSRLEDLRKEISASGKVILEVLEEPPVQKSKQKKEEEVMLVPPGEKACYSAPLTARVHLRAASWRWHIVGAMPALSPVRPPYLLAPCFPARLPGGFIRCTLPPSPGSCIVLLPFHIVSFPPIRPLSFLLPSFPSPPLAS